MYDNNRGGRGSGGGRGNFSGGSRRGGGRDDRRQESFRVKCSNCGDMCDVPFKPTGDKPVFCSDCFRDQNGGGERRGGRDERNNRRGRDFEEKKMYKAVCDECGETCELPFKPSGDKPVFCSDCFLGNEKPSSKKGDDMKEEIRKLNEKLDMIIRHFEISEEKKDKTIHKLTKDLKLKETVIIPAETEDDDIEI